MKQLNHIATRIFNTPLMIHQPKMEAILSVLMQRLEAGAAPIQAAAGGKPARKPYTVTQEDLAVISVVGPLVKRASGGFLSGGPTTYGEIEHEFMDAANDPAIKGILLDMDSPGGEVGGLLDLCDMIYGQRGAKPIYAVANDDCYSAAYAIASAAERIYVTRAGGIGSIGVIAMHCDQSHLDANIGLKYTFVTAGARKKDFNPHEPLSDSAMGILQAEVDRLAGLFHATVSKNRNIALDRVASMEAGLFFGQKALAAGLADSEGTLEDAARDMIAALNKKTSPGRPGKQDSAKAEVSPAPSAEHEQEKQMDPTKPADAATSAAVENKPQPTQADIDKLVVDARIAGHADAADIAAVCVLAGKPEKIAGFLAGKTSRADVSNELLAARKADDAAEIANRVDPAKADGEAARNKVSIVTACEKLAAATAKKGGN
jgi:signal peptide peptidase SppA